jgi:branched-chain amino acid transport system permease protein
MAEPAALADRRRPGRGPGRLLVGLWRGRTWNQVFWLLVLVVALYLFVPNPSLAIEVLIFGLWAVSTNLLLGYGGLVSFGHALYFVYGSYAAGLLLTRHLTDSLWVSLLGAMGLAGLVAVGAGFVCLRRRDVYFSMLTLAFAQLGYFIAFEARWLTGGDDGLRNIPTPPIALPGVTIPLNPLADPATFFSFTAILVILCFLLLLLFTESPLGRVLQAIRESEERARGCGYNTRLVQLITFTVSGMFAGLAGGLNAVFNGLVGLDPFWLLSGEVVIMVILGGRSTLFGSMVGATAYLLLQHYLSNAFPEWQLILGGIFVAIVLAFPQGLWGLFRLERSGGVTGMVRRARGWVA